MASTYTQNTGIEKPGSGDQSGTWGVTVNTNSDIIDNALHGQASIAVFGSQDLTTSDGASSDGGAKVLVLTGTPGGVFELRVTPTDQQKYYVIKNETDSACRIIYKGVTYSTSNGVEIASGSSGAVTGDGGGAVSGVFKSLTPSTDLVNDLTPKLGGDLNVNGQSIISASNGNIEIAPNGTGELNITGSSNITGDLDVDNININGNAITATNTNGNLSLAANGNGNVIMSGLVYPNADGTAGQSIVTDGTGNLSFSSGFSSGMVMPYAGSSAPADWFLCYGQAVSRTTYSSLFSVIGTTYGSGDGSTTFNLPDLRGRVVAGQDDMGGSSANRLTNQSGGVNGDTLGAAGGAETHTLTTAQMPAHNHTGVVQQREDYNPTSGATTQTPLGFGDTRAGSRASASPLTIDNTGGGGAHNNVQPTFVLNYIIKT